MKKRFLTSLALALTMAIPAFGMTACDFWKDKEEDDGGVAGWGETWDNWGLDGWGTPDEQEPDPGDVDWSEKYPGMNSSAKAYDVSDDMTMRTSQHMQIFQAEKAELTGKANCNEAGWYAGSFDDSTITFTIRSAVERDVLLVVSLATAGDSTGYAFNSIFELSFNDSTKNTTGCQIKATAGWATFEENVVIELTLKAGENRIEMYSSVGHCNMDYIKLIPAGALSQAAFVY